MKKMMVRVILELLFLQPMFCDAMAYPLDHLYLHKFSKGKI